MNGSHTDRLSVEGPRLSSKSQQGSLTDGLFIPTADASRFPSIGPAAVPGDSHTQVTAAEEEENAHTASTTSGREAGT